MRTAALILAATLAACSPPAEAPPSGPDPAVGRLSRAVSAELKTDRAWGGSGGVRQLVYGGVTYEVRPVGSGAAELRAVLPSDSEDAQMGRAAQVVLAAGAGQHQPGADLTEIATALQDNEPVKPRVINGVEVWQEGDALIARPIAR